MDKQLCSLEDETLGSSIEHRVVDMTSHIYFRWLSESGLLHRGGNYREKKALEFFFSAMHLAPGKNDILLDAAGGRSGYIDAIRALYSCHRMYLHDHIYQGLGAVEDGLAIVGDDAVNIPLPDGPVNRISWRHLKNYNHCHSAI